MGSHGQEMLIFWKEKLVVLAVPKTGTTAFEEALAPHADVVFRHPAALKHLNMERLHGSFARLFHPLTPSEFTFIGMMREPREWLGSWYRYRARPQLRNGPRSTFNMTFDDFVKAYLSENQPEFARVGSQHRFLCGKSGETPANLIFDYSDSQTYKGFLEDRLGRKFSIPRRNVSSAEVSLDLSEQTEGALRDALSVDFELYARVQAAGPDQQ